MGLLQVKRAKVIHQRLQSRPCCLCSEEDVAKILSGEMIIGESLVILGLNLTIKVVD